jgi:hypothetical protein
MVADMAYKKVTMTLPEHVLGDAQQAARDAGMPFSTFVARAVWNETLRRQLESARVPELPEWLDDAEADEAGEDRTR